MWTFLGKNKEKELYLWLQNRKLSTAAEERLINSNTHKLVESQSKI